MLKRYIISIISILIIFPVFATGCSKQVLIDDYKSKSLNYNFTIANVKNIDKTLSKQKYIYSAYSNRKYVAIITYKSHKASIKQYPLDNHETLELTIPKDSKFVISLHANSTTIYTWNIKNNIDNGIIQLENRSWINIPLPLEDRHASGASYDRQNFYFKPLKEGNEQVIMRYEHQTMETNGYFEAVFNIKIQ